MEKTFRFFSITFKTALYIIGASKKIKKLHQKVIRFKKWCYDVGKKREKR